MCQPFIARLKKNVVDSAKKMTLFVLYQQSAFVFAFFYSIYCIYEGNLDTSTYYLPLRLATPFNIEQSLFGWYLVWALQFMGGITYMFAIVVTLHSVCCCFYLEALCNHFDLLIESVDAEFCDNQGEPNDDFIWKNARKLFIDAIDHHNTIYEWGYLFSGLSSNFSSPVDFTFILSFQDIQDASRHKQWNNICISNIECSSLTHPSMRAISLQNKPP